MTSSPARDIEAWRRSGHATHVIPIAPRPAQPEGQHPAPESAREINAILFTDLAGFSGLRDEHFPVYVRVVLGALAQVLDRHRDALLGYNSWGAAIQAVLLALLTSLGLVQLWHIYVLAFVLGLTNAFDSPDVTTTLSYRPQKVGEECSPSTSAPR